MLTPTEQPPHVVDRGEGSIQRTQSASPCRTESNAALEIRDPGGGVRCAVAAGRPGSRGRPRPRNTVFSARNGVTGASTAEPGDAGSHRAHVLSASWWPPNHSCDEWVGVRAGPCHGWLCQIFRGSCSTGLATARPNTPRINRSVLARTPMRAFLPQPAPPQVLLPPPELSRTIAQHGTP